MGLSNGDYKAIGSRNKAKHEKNRGNSRASITAYRTGVVSGNQDPTIDANV